MPISSKSLFHYTAQLESLKSILRTGFRYSFCNEELPGLGYGQYVDKYLSVNRTVCFCDIPLSQSTSHRSQYGGYIIAMSKAWALNVGVTPIRYLHNNSPDIRAHFFKRFHEISYALSHCEGGVFEFYSNYLKEVGFPSPPSYETEILKGSKGLRKVLSLIEDDYLEVLESYVRLIGLSRIYEGEWRDRETEKVTTRCFYDEREWRAIAIQNVDENLKFKFADINYLIVHNQKEQRELAKFLTTEKLDELEVPKDESEVWSKILTSDLILRDV